MTEHQNLAPQADVVIVHSPAYENWVFNSTHPTQGRRFTNGYNAVLEKVGSSRRIQTIEPRLATRDELALVHTSDYIKAVLDLHTCNEWDGARPDLAKLAQTFVGGTLEALDQLLTGNTQVAVHLPGAKHHAQADTSSGFCVFADFAIAAKVAVAQGLKVAIFDFDAHHGDGTENLCADDPNILTYSVHEQNLFPWTGLKSKPKKHVYNKAIKAQKLVENSNSFADIEQLIDAALEFGRLAIDFGADIIFLAAGADGHHSDQLSRLSYDTGILIKVIGSIFHHETLSQLPVLIGGAGGYQPDDVTPKWWAETVNHTVSFVSQPFQTTRTENSEVGEA